MADFELRFISLGYINLWAQSHFVDDYHLVQEQAPQHYLLSDVGVGIIGLCLISRSINMESCLVEHKLQDQWGEVPISKFKAIEDGEFCRNWDAKDEDSLSYEVVE